MERHDRSVLAVPRAAWLAIAAVPLACSDPAAPDPSEPADVAIEVVAQGFASPVYLTAPPGDDRLFVVERGGRIRIIDGGATLPAPFLDVSGEIAAGGERGLLSMAFHPDYATNGYFFVDYTDRSGDTQVVRYHVSADPNVADPASASTVLSVDQPFSNHNGGLIDFGPDGMLYIAMGDGGDGGDPLGHGQNPATLLGSMLRIDVDGGSPYAIPADNPYVGHPTARGETWAYGLRNPWRFSFDRATGDLYIADVGQNALEEVSYQAAASPGGENYGWNVTEGSACYRPPSGCSTVDLTPPVHEYDHGQGCSITGGYVYRGSSAPELHGRYFFADFCETWIRSFVVVNGVAEGLQDHSEALGPVASVSSFGEGADGELYVVSLGGTVYRLGGGLAP